MQRRLRPLAGGQQTRKTYDLRVAGEIQGNAALKGKSRARHSSPAYYALIKHCCPLLFLDEQRDTFVSSAVSGLLKALVSSRKIDVAEQADMFCTAKQLERQGRETF